MKNTSVIFGAVLAVMLSSGAHAAQVNFNNTGQNIVAQDLCQIGQTNPNADDCRGVFNDGNVSSNPDDFSNNIDLNVDFFSQDGSVFEEGLFGEDDWNLLARSTGGVSDGLSYSTQNNSLGWSFLTDVSIYEQVVLGFKQSTESVFYLFDAATFSSTGSFDLTVFSNPGISNVTAWARGTSGGGGNGPGDPPPVPLPAAGWMLLAGVGGLAAWGRRRRQAV